MNNWEIYNSKALNLDALKNSDKNVTLGFKCDPALKLHLAEEAESIGISLSSYVNNLVKENQALIDEINHATEEEIEMLTQQNIVLKQKIKFYENEILQDLFERHKAQTIKYKKTSGEAGSQPILEIKDVYTVLINSFKYEK